nr:MAG TPA: hypothetical protein [Caudoviricetes sp.]
MLLSFLWRFFVSLSHYKGRKSFSFHQISLKTNHPKDA